MDVNYQHKRYKLNVPGNKGTVSLKGWINRLGKLGWGEGLKLFPFKF